MVARVEGVATREAAAALTGVELFARRAQLPPPDADEFYHDDLVGLEAVTPTARRSAAWPRVLNHGAGDILEIAPPAAARRCCCRSRNRSRRRSISPPGASSSSPPPEIDGEATARILNRFVRIVANLATTSLTAFASRRRTDSI